MYNQFNRIYLEKQNKVFINNEMKNKTGELLNVAYAIQMNENIKSLGYVMSISLMNELLTLKSEHIGDFYKIMLEVLKEKAGANVKHKPMYKNFPKSVVEATDMELLINQLYGYLVDFYGYVGTEISGDVVDFREFIKFDGEVKERIELKDKIEYKIINLGTEEEFCEIFKNMMASRNSISEYDSESLAYFLMAHPKAEKYIPGTVPFKEVLALVFDIALKKGFPVESLPLKTATDVLRLAVVLSDGDVSLAKKTRFKNFTRKEKTILLTALNNINEYSLIEDISRRKEVFKRLCEKLDLFSERYSKKYARIHEVMRGIYDHKHFVTYRSRLASALVNKNTVDAVALLKKRPGEFARSLDKALRDSGEHVFYVLEHFAEIANEVPTAILWDLYYHFKFRDENADRIAFPKGKVSNAVLIKEKLEPLPQNVLRSVCSIIREAIICQYEKREEMKYVYVNPELQRYIMPFSSRSASKNSELLTRGTRLSLRKDAKAIRMFTYWVGKDVDLSAVFLDKNFDMVGHVSYTSLHWGTTKEKLAYHSGDVTYAPNGASEFIDVKISQIKKEIPELRYIAMCVYDFTEIGFDNMDTCFCGVMERDDVNTGEIFEPATVKVKADISGEKYNNFPLLIDLETNEVIWTDISTRKDFDSPEFNPNNVESNVTSLQLACRAFANLKKVNMYEVIMANVEARKGKLVSYSTTVNEANEEMVVLTDVAGNIIEEKDVLFFDVDKGITPKDVEKLTAEYL